MDVMDNLWIWLVVKQIPELASQFENPIPVHSRPPGSGMRATLSCGNLSVKGLSHGIDLGGR